MVKREEMRVVKRAVAAFLVCAVMVLVAAVPLVGADVHHVVRSSQGPRASIVSWDYSPAVTGVWTGHVVNSGLRSLAVDVYDTTTGAAYLIFHQRIRFAETGNDMSTSPVSMAKNHKYSIAATPSGPKGASCTVEDVFVPISSPVAVFNYSVAGAVVSVDGSASYDPNPAESIVGWGWDWGDGAVATGVTATHRYSSAGTYTILLTLLSSTGVTSSISQDVTLVDKPPVASFTVARAGSTVSVDASASTDDFGIVNYTWDWGDGTFGFGMNASHTYPSLPVVVQPMTEAASRFPFMVWGYVYLPDGISPAIGAAVRVTNLMSGFYSSSITDGTGLYVANMDDSTGGPPDSGGPMVGDIMSVTAVMGPMIGWNEGTFNSEPYIQLDVKLSVQGMTFPITLTVTDTIGQTGNATQEVSFVPINSPPVASYSWTASGMTVAFNAGSSYDTDGTIVLFSWDFGDGSTGSGATVYHTFSAARVYQVVLTVADNLGATGSQVQSVTVPSGPLVTLFSDNFDDSSIADWTLTTSGGPITVDPSTGMAAAPSMKLYKQQRLGSTLATHDFAPVTSGHVIAEANLKVDSVATGAWKWTYFNLYSSSGVVQTYFGLVDGWMRYYTATLGWQSIGVAYLADTWYDIKLDVDLGAGTYDIFINGVMEKAGAPLWGPGPHTISRVGFQAGTLDDLFGMTMWADGVMVSRTGGLVSPPQASFTYSAVGSTISVDASSSSAEAGIASYTWNWGDGSPPYTLALPSMSHTYPIGSASPLPGGTPFPGGGIPSPPFLLYGYTHGSDGVTPLPGCLVNISDTRTGQSWTLVSDGTGLYTIDLYSFTNLLSGDTIRVYAVNGAFLGSGSGVISASDVYLGLDITLMPTVTVTLTVTDTLGQTATVSQVITLADLLSPP